MQVASLICAPLVRGGTLVAVLVMCDSTPRQWTSGEATLLEQVAERTLFAVESARAAQALREKRDVLSLAMHTGHMGAWWRDLVLDRVWWSPDLAEILGLSPDDTTMIATASRAGQAGQSATAEDASRTRSRHIAITRSSSNSSTPGPASGVG